MEKRDLVMDVQGFHDKDGNFIPKEIAVVGVDSNFVSHWLIKPPYDYAEMSKGIIATNSYLTCYQHGIEWFDGESNLKDVYNSLKEVARGALRIYARGTLKVDLLEKVISRQIVNLEDYQCPSFKNLPNIDDHYCFYHGNKKEFFACSLTYAYKLKYWLIKTLYVSNECSVDEVDLKKERLKAEAARNSTINAEREATKTQSAPQCIADSTTTTPSTTDNSRTLGVGSSTVTTTTTTATIHKPRRSSPPKPNRQSRYEVATYEKVDSNEYHSDKACPRPRTSADGRSFSGRQDTVCTSETVCGCS